MEQKSEIVRIEGNEGPVYLRPSDVSQIYRSGKEGFALVEMASRFGGYHLIPGTPDEVAEKLGLRLLAAKEAAQP